jgi:hypothetical protein
MFLTIGREGYSDVLISMESMSNKDYFSRFMDFRESPTLAMLRSGLNTLRISLFSRLETAKVTRPRG